MKSSIALCTLLLLYSQPVLSQKANYSESSPQTSQNFDGPTLYQLLIGEMALNRQDFTTALKAYTLATETTQDPKIAAKATDIAIFVGRPKIALQMAEIWAKQSPQDMEAQAIAALLLISQHQNSASIPYLAKIQNGDDHTAMGFFQLLYEQLHTEKDKTFFINALNALNDKNKNKLGAALALSNIYITNNDPESALKITSDAVIQVKNNETLYILHSESLRLVQKETEADHFIEKVLKENPHMLDLRLFQIEALLTQKNMNEKARTKMNTLVAISDIATPTLLQAIQISFDVGWIPETQHFLQKIEQDPRYSGMAAYFSGRIAELQQRPKEALVHYSKLESGPFYVIARIHAANILSKAGEYEQALQWISSTYPETRSDLKMITFIEVDLLSKMNRLPEALNAVDLALSETPNDLDLHYIRSLIYEQMGNLSSAEDVLRYILQHNQKHVEALNSLGYILTTHSDRHQEAISYLAQAYAISPNNPAILDSLGWAYYHLGETEKALFYLKSAYHMEPDTLTAAHFGEVLWETGDTQGARQVWKNANLKTNPHPHYIATVKKYDPGQLAMEN